VRLAWELGIIQRYLDLERPRCGDHLQLSIEIGPGAGDALVPPLLLLPLADNAVKHGVARRAGGGQVAVRATREGDRLWMTVRNDFAAPAAGSGLRGVYRRLAEAYGDEARLAYIPDHPEGVLVTLELPFKS
jgi:LytS/YehU family sensor histidine kinase